MSNETLPETTFGGYLWRWGKAAFWKAWELFGLLGLVVGLALWAAHRYYPEPFKQSAARIGFTPEAAMSDLVWLIPIVLAALAFGWRLIRAPYEIHRDLERERNSAEQRLSQLLEPKASLVYDETDHRLHVQHGEFIYNGYRYDEVRYVLGVLNESRAPLRGMSVVVESGEPYESGRIYVNQPLEYDRRETGDGTFTLNTTDGHVPSASVLMFHELRPRNGEPAMIRIGYHRGINVGKWKWFADKAKSRVVTFRLQGDGLSESVSITVRVAEDGHGHYEVTRIR